MFQKVCNLCIWCMEGLINVCGFFQRHILSSPNSFVNWRINNCYLVLQELFMCGVLIMFLFSFILFIKTCYNPFQVVLCFLSSIIIPMMIAGTRLAFQAPEVIIGQIAKNNPIFPIFALLLEFPKRIRIVNRRIRIPFFQTILDTRISVDGYLDFCNLDKLQQNRSKIAVKSEHKECNGLPPGKREKYCFQLGIHKRFMWH